MFLWDDVFVFVGWFLQNSCAVRGWQTLPHSALRPPFCTQWGRGPVHGHLQRPGPHRAPGPGCNLFTAGGVVCKAIPRALPEPRRPTASPRQFDEHREDGNETAVPTLSPDPHWRSCIGHVSPRFVNCTESRLFARSWPKLQESIGQMQEQIQEPSGKNKNHTSLLAIARPTYRTIHKNNSSIRQEQIQESLARQERLSGPSPYDSPNGHCGNPEGGRLLGCCANRHGCAVVPWCVRGTSHRSHRSTLP
jgi:hypothetical protein